MTDDTPRGMVIGITGGIGSGKSVVSRLLRLKGYDVYDCDTRAKEIMESIPEVRAAIRDIVGEDAYRGDGKLDRPRVAQAIFSDEERLDRLNSVVHRAVALDLNGWSAGRRLCFVESAILFSSGLAGACSEVWLVDAPEALRIERALARSPHMSRSDVEARIMAQRYEFASLDPSALRTILNSGSESLFSQVNALLGEAEEKVNHNDLTEYHIHNKQNKPC